MIIRVKRDRGEEVRRKLVSKRLLGAYRIESDGNWVYLGTKRNLAPPELNELGAQSVERNLEKKEVMPENLRQILKKKLTGSELELVPRSYDVVGSVAVLLIPDELEVKEDIIAGALLKVHGNVKTVVKRIGPVGGTYRTRQIEVLAGEGNTETSYREHGCDYQLDLRDVFFTPRLATERLRIAQLARNEETVFDMFAGVGPFAILIAKKKGCKVHALDLNPHAYEYLKKNIRVNKVVGMVNPILGDARDAPQLVPKVDRIVMNLPHGALNFVKPALGCIDEGTIHYHCFSPEDEFDESVNELRGLVKKEKRKFELLEIRRIRQIAPREWNIGIDFSVS